MSRVNITGGGHQVEVQHDGADLVYVIEKAQKLWTETKPEGDSAGPAFGYQAQTQSSPNGAAYFRYGERPVVEG